MKDKPKFMLRFPDDHTRDDLKERARKNYRSLNSEIVTILKQALASSEAVEGEPLPHNTPSAAILTDA